MAEHARRRASHRCPAPAPRGGRGSRRLPNPGRQLVVLLALLVVMVWCARLGNG
ncbi:hypothetical protein ACIQWR_20040 [Streptomyces sp. NPDC098789]|uniref:hypothetical protein n=1 Tax=Streptomyces sp. NPDC098789 TaxID=3366098 RepID=UPI00381BDB84